MANFTLGQMMQIGFRLISNREQILKTWNEVAPLVKEVMRLAPEIKKLVEQVVPELLEKEPKKGVDFDVAWVQQSLNALINAGLDVDGDYGPLTKKAIEDYQRSRKLVVDGWAGVATTAALYADMGKRRA